MSDFDKWLERVYGETDFGRSVATSVAGAAGLAVYLIVDDWVVSLFSAVITFPVARLLSTWAYERTRRLASRQVKRENAKEIYSNLTPQERNVVQAFVQVGGCVLTWGQTNSLDLPGSAVESLMQRGIIETSITADGMRETFVLDPVIFDVALGG